MEPLRFLLNIAILDVAVCRKDCVGGVVREYDAGLVLGEANHPPILYPCCAPFRPPMMYPRAVPEARPKIFLYAMAGSGCDRPAFYSRLSGLALIGPVT